MARTIEVIQSQIEATVVSSFSDIGVVLESSKWSKRNIIRLFCYISAVCANYIEQLMDIQKTDVEVQVSKSTGGNANWLQSKVFEFQYVDGVAQSIEIVNGIASYNPIDINNRIITACSIVSPLLNSVVIKVAKNSPLEALSPTELSALQGYVNILGTVGINYNCVSNDPDLVEITANIYYDKYYSSTIEQSVIDAIENFIENLSVTNFNGSLKLSDIEYAIKSVVGVKDIVFTEVACRPATASFGSRVFMVLDSKTLVREWNSTAGYNKSETETGYKLADTLTFIGE